MKMNCPECSTPMEAITEILFGMVLRCPECGYAQMDDGTPITIIDLNPALRYDQGQATSHGITITLGNYESFSQQLANLSETIENINHESEEDSDG